MVTSGLSGCSKADSDAAGQPVERLAVHVTATYRHDPASFTEGLVVDEGGRMLESVGRYGQSAVREVEIDTGQVLNQHALDPTEFGEGIAEHDGVITQLTWHEHVAHRWSDDELESLGSRKFGGEGWGLTFDPQQAQFIQSNGSSTLTRRASGSFAVVGTIAVRLNGRPVDQLNELEFVDGQILANVWHSDQIMRIDAATGRVTAVIDASGLWSSPQRTSEMVLNGIAHRGGDPASHLLLTGKNWPALYEVDLVAAPPLTVPSTSARSIPHP